MSRSVISTVAICLLLVCAGRRLSSGTWKAQAAHQLRRQKVAALIIARQSRVSGEEALVRERRWRDPRRRQLSHGAEGRAARSNAPPGSAARRRRGVVSCAGEGGDPQGLVAVRVDVADVRSLWGYGTDGARSASTILARSSRNRGRHRDLVFSVPQNKLRGQASPSNQPKDARVIRTSSGDGQEMSKQGLVQASNSNCAAGPSGVNWCLRCVLDFFRTATLRC